MSGSGHHIQVSVQKMGDANRLIENQKIAAEVRQEDKTDSAKKAAEEAKKVPREQRTDKVIIQRMRDENSTPRRRRDEKRPSTDSDETPDGTPPPGSRLDTTA